MAVSPQLESSWKQALSAEFEKPYFDQLKAFLVKEKAAGCTVYPRGSQIFNAFLQTPLPKVRVVILGQDPYHGPGQAMGLSFSVPNGVPPPPSLKNMFAEISRDLGVPQRKTGDLTAWAKQGVLLLNTVLTVRASQAHSHQGQGWEQFTDAVIRLLNQQDHPLIFVLWGNPARAKLSLIDPNKHEVLQAAHPSPLSAHRGFMGCGHFSKINQQLTDWGQEPIDWITSCD